MWLTLSSSLVSYHWPVFCDMQRGKCNLYLIPTKCVLVLLWGRSKSQQQTKLREKCGNIQMFKWWVIFFTNIFSFLPRPSQSFREKKKHVQTDKMWNIGRRKCKYFGAASFSFFIFHFSVRFFSFETQELLNSSAPSFFPVSKCADAFSLCPLLPSQLLDPSLLTPDDLLGTERKTDQMEGTRRKKKMYSLVF